ncbi:MAG: zinc-binding dehydrogenase [Erysipelotrichaceae bacterium]|nr:zinc-binding dehydrogenase [Erysipelotrichaceae bacterium]
MKAVVIDKVTKAEDVILSEAAIPETRPGWVLIKVKGFGLNHSEQLLRLSEINAPYIKKPIIPGIECVGEVIDPSDSDLKAGQKVISLMGGMGRSFNGSYAEFALLPRKQVFPVETELSWKHLAAIPETYFTAWGSLFECLDLKKDDVLLIRGATCALGYAAIQIGKALGCKVIGTTHRENKMSLLKDAGCDECVLDEGVIAGKVKGVNKLLDLIGPKYLKDSLNCVMHKSIVCQAGILGSVYTLNGFDPIKDIPNGVFLTSFFSNYPDQKVIDEIMKFINDHELVPLVGATFGFDEIKEALIAMDSHSVNGKIVITL